jgi:DNA-binding NtrC family response regulator
MPHNILILDDDTDFNSLLTDIFEQADYVVSSQTDPKEALGVFRETDFDLVVTDHKMPGMTGTDFMKRIKAVKPGVPVIMVSGFLENDTIRELIREGVGGVFLKPLNIFSLLERSREVIDESKKLAATARDEAAAEAGEESESDLPFPFHSFAGKSKSARAFAKRLYDLRNFKTTLSLVGEKGTHFRKICEDIGGFFRGKKEAFLFLEPASFDAEKTVAEIEELSDEGAQRVTCVLIGIDEMSEEQKTQAASIPRKGGLFQELDPALRAIFCMTADLDDLYDEGLVNENLYMLIGTTEVKVPALRDCAADAPALAQQILAQLAEEQQLSAVPEIEHSARDLIGSHKWEGNYAALEKTLRLAVESGASKVLTYGALKKALASSTHQSARGRLEAHLANYQLELIRATAHLLGGDPSSVASFFACDEVEKIESRLK